jgi:hypothetical protein
VERRVAQGHPPDRPADRSFGPDAVASEGWIGAAGALGFGLLALFAYWVGDEGTVRYYNHFVWQALAFLDGRAAIDYPVAPSGDLPGNDYFQDVLPLRAPDGTLTGRGLIPFPPLPALLLTPFVAVWGIRTDAQAIAGLFGAIDVALVWWVLGRLPIRTATRAVTTLFFGFGTVFFYAAELGTTWYLAHVVAVAFLLVAIGIALGADPRAASGNGDARPAARRASAPAAVGRFGPLGRLDARQFVAGVLFGLACTARLPIAFGGIFFVLVGGGGGWLGRGASAALGAVIPVAALVGYNVVSTGEIFHPAYEYLYQAEAYGYPTLGYNPGWGIEDPRYIPQNLVIALFSTPVLLPDLIPAALGAHTPLCSSPDDVRGLFNERCPLLLPRDTGMSILLTSPAYLLALPAIRRRYGRDRVVTGASIAVLLIFVVNLMHFSQGWVQFGYRFSNDFVAFALLLVALGIQRLQGRPFLVGALVVASIGINLWGAIWGALLGW